MSTRHADRKVSIYPLIGLGLLTLGLRVDVIYTPNASPRGAVNDAGDGLTGTPRRWCVHWSVACGSWQTGGALCDEIERAWTQVRRFAVEVWERMGEIGKPKPME